MCSWLGTDGLWNVASSLEQEEGQFGGNEKTLTVMGSGYRRGTASCVCR